MFVSVYLSVGQCTCSCVCYCVYWFVCLYLCICLCDKSGGRKSKARWSFASHYDREEEGEDGAGLDAAPEDTTNGASADIRGTPPQMKREATSEEISN